MKSYGVAKGFGFVTSDEVAGDIYFKTADLPAELRQAHDDSFFQLGGRAVLFELNQTKDGKPLAKNIQVVVNEGEQVLGEVKSYSQAKGFGFVKSSMVAEDVYFQRKDVPAQLHSASIQGMAVRFQVHVTPDGKVQARQLAFSAGAAPQMQMQMQMMQMQMPAQWSPAMAKGGGGKGCGGPPAPMGMKGMKGSAKGQPQWFPSPAAMAEGANLTGVVKSFVEAKGYGFINTPTFPGDIYFKPDTPVEAGQQVSFTLRWTRDGKPQAQNVTGALGGGEVLVGTVKSFNEKTGYGFVTVEGHPQDIYFQKKDLPEELQSAGESLVGAQVQFTARVTKDGKPQMQDAEFLETPGTKRPAGPSAITNGAPAKRPRTAARPSAAPAAARPTSQVSRNYGVVKSYNAAKGFGFVECAAVIGDVYFQRAALPGPAQQNKDLAGQPVSFELKHTADGKPQAANIQVDS